MKFERPSSVEQDGPRNRRLNSVDDSGDYKGRKLKKKGVTNKGVKVLNMQNFYESAQIYSSETKIKE